MLPLILLLLLIFEVLSGPTCTCDEVPVAAWKDDRRDLKSLMNAIPKGRLGVVWYSCCAMCNSELTCMQIIYFL